MQLRCCRSLLIGLFIISEIFIATQLEAQSQKKKIVYGSTSWNTDSTQVDSAFLFIQEKKTGKIAKILLDETAPDSSTFSGNFSLSWTDAKDVDPAIYIPPQDLRGEEGLAKFKTLLTEGRLKRRAVVFKTEPSGEQIIEVFDTKEQAKKAYAAYQKELELLKRQQRASDLLKRADTEEAKLAALKVAEKEAEKKRLEMQALKQEAERIRLEQIERQKTEERKKRQQALKEAERKKRRDQAVRIAYQALDQFKAGNFQRAEELFENAVDLDPENTTHYYSYGVTLYRNEKFNESLVILNQAGDDPQTNIEKDYYKGLNHYRLKEYEPALNWFKKVKSSSDESLGPSASFYIGIIHFDQERWDMSEQHFQYVLDNSKDPRLDERAEGYIENIAHKRIWERKQSQRFTLSTNLSLVYDSNVLQSPDGIEATETAISDVRGMFTGGLAYRALYLPKHEVVPTYNVYYEYSSKDEVSRADIFLNAIYVPYNYKGTLWDKGYSMQLKPGYEVTNLDNDEDGVREVILYSTLLSNSHTFVMSDRWFSTYGLEVSLDDSQLEPDSPEDNADATKVTASTTNINFLDRKKKKLLVSTLKLVFNQADGSDKLYNELNASASYYKPLHWWESTWNLGLTVYKREYPDHSDNRSDMNVSLTTGITRPITELLQFGFTLNYATNNSEAQEYSYNRYLVTTSISSEIDF